MECSLPGSSVHGISQTRVLEWVAISSSRGIFQTLGLNLHLLCLLHWHVGSLPLSHQRSKRWPIHWWVEGWEQGPHNSMCSCPVSPLLWWWGEGRREGWEEGMLWPQKVSSHGLAFKSEFSWPGWVSYFVYFQGQRAEGHFLEMVMPVYLGIFKSWSLSLGFKIKDINTGWEAKWLRILRCWWKVRRFYLWRDSPMGRSKEPPTPTQGWVAQEGRTDTQQCGEQLCKD